MFTKIKNTLKLFLNVFNKAKLMKIIEVQVIILLSANIFSTTNSLDGQDYTNCEILVTI
jgi:hypothetical protein